MAEARESEEDRGEMSAHGRRTTLRAAARRVYGVLAIVSLLLCVGSLGVWGWMKVNRPTSQVMLVDVRRATTGTEYHVNLGMKLILFRYEPLRMPLHGPPLRVFGRNTPTQAAWREELAGSQWRWAGLGVMRIPRGTVDADGEVLLGWTDALFVPYYALAIIFAVLPMHWAMILRRRRQRAWRVSHNLCAGCGYDLRASAERCPECGRVRSGPAGRRTRRPES